MGGPPPGGPTEKLGSGEYRLPVVKLEKALYGRPDAGGFWEQKCSAHLEKMGLEPVADWPSLYWLPKLKFKRFATSAGPALLGLNQKLKLEIVKVV